MTQEDILKSFTISKFLIKIIAEDNLSLPAYKGSTFRGAFGIAFKKVCCIQRQVTCDTCILKEKCAYSFIFESSPQKNAENLSNLDEIPRPFVIEPPLTTKKEFFPGDELEFSFILFGKAIEYLPYMIYAFSQLGKIGIGKNRGKFKLKQITDENGAIVYDGATETINKTDTTILLDFIRFAGINTLHLSFITPTRIKYEGHYIDKPEFHIIMRTLLRRISSLMYFYCGKQLELDYKNLISLSRNSIIKKSNLNWVDWERYSSRQDIRMKLGGFVGDVVYEGDFKPFLPLLTLGEYTHIGKNCTFGLGKYKIKTGKGKNVSE